MEITSRLGLGAALGLAVGTFAASASAAYTPKLIVQAQGQQTTINVSQDATDDSTARIVIYAPRDVSATLNQPPRTQIGSVRGLINILDLAPPAGVNQEFTGGITTVAPSEAPPTVALCAPGAHDAIWVVSPTAAGASLEAIPMVVDRITTGPEAAFASAKITVCFRPPDIPQGTPGRSPSGARLLQASFTLLGVFTSPTGGSSLAWNALFTPYTPRVGQVNGAATAQAQSVRRSAPAALTLRGSLSRRGKRTFARLTGRLTGSPGARVQLFAGNRSLGFVTASSTGAFSKTVAIKTTTSFRARASVAPLDVTSGGCSPAIPLTATLVARCASVTAGFATTVQSKTVTVRVKKAKRGR